MVSEILGFKLKKKNNDNKDKKKNWRNGLFAISPHVNSPIQTNFLVDIHIDLGYHPAVSKAENESENWNFRMYRHNGPSTL